jgi:hypothetical protein
MEQKKPEWWQQTGASNNAIAPQADKWYNNSAKLLLSVLFWPLFLYGWYKTALVTKKTKQILFAVLIGFAIIGAFSHNDKASDGTSPLTVPDWVSRWDHSVSSVEHYVKHQYLRDPDSYESVKWYLPLPNADGTYQVTHTFRAKNGFGGMNEETHIFTVSSDGETVINVN